MGTLFEQESPCRLIAIAIVSIPSLPVIKTRAANKAELDQVGWAHLTKMVVKPFGWLDADDAARDGFKSLPELKETLKGIYGKIPDTEYVSIYSFELHEQA